MASITREQLEMLIDLQEKEREAARIQSELDRIPEKTAAMDQALTAYEDAIESRKADLSAMKKDYRAREADLEMNQSRIGKRDTQLKSVNTNREYQSILKEIDDIRRTNSRIEDEMLQCLDDMDRVERALSDEQNRYNAEKQKIEAEKADLEKDAEARRDKLAQLKEESAKIAAQLDAKLVKRYYSIKANAGGVAIVPVEDAVCRGCYLNIPPQMYNELYKGDELRFCPHCHRMIYVL